MLDIQSFIKMYGYQDKLSVREGADGGYQVSLETAKDEYDIYLCETLNDAGDCVNRIIFDLPLSTS